MVPITSRTDGGPAVITCEDGTSVVVHDGERAPKATQAKRVLMVPVFGEPTRWWPRCDYVRGWHQRYGS